MNITPITFSTTKPQISKQNLTFRGGDYEDWYVKKTKKDNPKDVPKTNLKDFVGTAKRYIAPFVAGVVLTFAAQTVKHDEEKRALTNSFYKEQAASEVATKAMLESISKDLKDLNKVDSIEFKNVIGRFNKELIIYKDGKKIIYDADTKARYEALGGNKYVRTRFD